MKIIIFCLLLIALLPSLDCRRHKKRKDPNFDSVCANFCGQACKNTEDVANYCSTCCKIMTGTTSSCGKIDSPKSNGCVAKIESLKSNGININVMVQTQGTNEGGAAGMKSGYREQKLNLP